MRAITTLIIILSSSLVFAKPKDVADFYKESDSQYLKATKEKDFEKKVVYFKNLKASLEETLKLYEKESPKEGGTDELEVSKLYYHLENVFPIIEKKKLKSEDCDRQRQTILAHNSLGKPEDSPLSPPAKEALRWLDLLCK